MANLHHVSMKARELIHENRIEGTLKKWADYDLCKSKGLRPDIDIYDFERVFTTESDQQEAEKIMDKLGIVFRD